MSKVRFTRVSEVLACWPPGPPERENRHRSSVIGMLRLLVTRKASASSATRPTVRVAHRPRRDRGGAQPVKGASCATGSAAGGSVAGGVVGGVVVVVVGAGTVKSALSYSKSSTGVDDAVSQMAPTCQSP